MNIKTIIANVDKTAAAKHLVRIATAVSVGKAVNNVISDNVPLPENPISRFGVKVSVFVGGYVAAGYVVDALGDYTDGAIDEVLAAFHQINVASDENSEVLEGTIVQ